MKRILLIEDDKELVNLLIFHLEDEGYELDYEYDGAKGFKKAKNEHYDLIILDVNLPYKNGLEICKELRSLQILTPILMLTARSEEIDRILGLEFGADDYVSKPFSIRELAARIKAIFRRRKMDEGLAVNTSNSFLDRGELKIDVEKRKVQRNDKIIGLTPTEFNLLVIMASNPGKNYSKEILLDKVWGYEFHGFKHTVSSHINRLRSKIEKDPNEPQYILTTWGIGYRFTENW